MYVGLPFFFFTEPPFVSSSGGFCSAVEGAVGVLKEGKGTVVVWR